jgi:hypothetical protein
MKYNLMVRSWAKSGETIARKHKAIFDTLAELPPPWGLQGNAPPEIPDPGADLGCGVTISKLLGKGISGRVYYDYRRTFSGIESSEASFADFLDMSFNPIKVDFKQLVVDVLPKLIVAFDAYIAHIGDDKFVDLDFDAKRQYPWEGDRRLLVYRITPVCYMDSSICRLNFNLTPEQIAERLEGHVERVCLIHNGIYVVVTSDPLPVEQADVLCHEIKRIIVA